MKLTDYERPLVLRGVHFGPGTSAGFDINAWVDFLASLHLGWIKIVDDAGSLMEFAAACRAAGIMPIIRLYRQYPYPGQVRAKDWVAMKEYLRRGITRWFEIGNESNLWVPEWHPNYRPAWKEGDPAVYETDWFRQTALPLMMDSWVADANYAIELGAYPAFPALAQCGFHPVSGSIPFYRAMFNYLRDHHYDKTKFIFENGGWLAVHDATLNHFYQDESGAWHFEYPYDPVCQAAHPGRTIMDDDNSLLGHEAPRDMIYNRWKLRLPIISTEGGVFLDVGSQWDKKYPAISSAEYHGRATLAMFDWLDEYQETHPWWFGMCPWIVAGQILGHPSVWESESWKKIDREEPVVGILQASPPRRLDEGNDDGNGDGNGNGDSGDIEYIGLTQGMIDRLKIDPPANPDEPYWKVASVEIQPGTIHMSAFAIFPKGTNVKVRFYWQGDEGKVVEPKADPYAPEGAREWAASHPMTAAWGSFGFEIQANAERLFGFGLYGDNLELTHTSHHPVLVCYKWIEPSGPEPSPPPPPERAKGFDVSSYQKMIDWAKAAQGHDFVFIRASAGLTKDTLYDRNQAESKKQGLLRGAYHFLRADMDAAAQARLFAQTIASSSLEIIPRLDVEHWESSWPTQATVETFVAAFVQELACYTSIWEWDGHLHLQGNGGMPLLWVADYTHPDAPQLPSGWTEWEFWQHTSSGRIEGIEGNVDLDWFNGTAEQLRKKYQPEPEPSEFPRPPQDNGLGIHFSVDDISEASVAQQIKWAKAMRLRWATVGSSSRELFVRAAAQVWAEGIMPICRWIGVIGKSHDFAADARALIAAGVPPYVQIFNEPSDAREWKEERPADYVARWAGLWALKASEVAQAGGFPGLQCLHPYELQAAFVHLPPDDPTWKRVWFCSHNYGLNHPPDWHEDEWCVLGFQEFVQIFQDKLGFVPPIICGEGGWLYGASDDSRFPKVGDELHAAYHKEMFLWFLRGKLSDGSALPDYLYAVCPWILAGQGSEPWYGNFIKLVTLEAIKSIPEFVRGEETWLPPIDDLKEMALGWLGDMPVPQSYAFPAYARAKGYPIQASKSGQFDDKILGKIWALQAFCNETQTEYIVVYAIEGDWKRIEHTVIRSK